MQIEPFTGMVGLRLVRPWLQVPTSIRSATGKHTSNTEIELTEMEVICQFIFGMLLLPVFLYAQEKSSGKKMARKWFWSPQAHLKELAYTPTYGGFR